MPQPRRPHDLVADNRLKATRSPNRGVTKEIHDSSGSTSAHPQAVEELWQWKHDLSQGRHKVWMEECIRGRIGQCRAVKELMRPTNERRTNKVSYERELEAMMKFSHPMYARRFVKSYGWFSSDDYVYLVMEYLPHGSLQSCLDHPFPEVEARQITAQLLDGLEFMHASGFAHRDLKPPNILVVHPGPAWWVKITDFGLTKRIEESSNLHTFGIGTYGFMAPELSMVIIGPGMAYDDTPSHNQKVDIWALGETVSRMVTGDYPTFQSMLHLRGFVMQALPFPLEELSRVEASESCCGFVQLLMARLPAGRPTAAEAKKHQWLAGVAAFGGVIQDEIPDSVGDELPMSGHHTGGVAFASERPPSARWTTISSSDASTPTPTRPQSPALPDGAPNRENSSSNLTEPSSRPSNAESSISNLAVATTPAQVSSFQNPNPSNRRDEGVQTPAVATLSSQSSRANFPVRPNVPPNERVQSDTSQPPQVTPETPRQPQSDRRQSWLPLRPPPSVNPSHSASNGTPNNPSARVSPSVEQSPTPDHVVQLNPTYDIDDIIDSLLKVRGSRPGRLVKLHEADIRYLCTKAREIFISQPMLLELEAPIKVCGDIKGQYYDLLRFFEYGGFPPETNYLLLGNYVCHGKQSTEVICLLLAYKIKYPENFFLLRGNMEDAAMNRLHGFYDECKRRYDIKLWKVFTDVFNCLPVAAVIDEKIFCIHGGLSPDLHSMEQIRRIMRPTVIPDRGLLCDLVWSDPDKDITGWGESERGQGFTFGPDVVSRFCQKHDIDLVVRAHQVVEDGYEFFSKRQLVTIFSAPNYRGQFDNAGAMMSVDESLLCSFQMLKP